MPTTIKSKRKNSSELVRSEDEDEDGDYVEESGEDDDYVVCGRKW